MTYVSYNVSNTVTLSIIRYDKYTTLKTIRTPKTPLK